MPTSRRVEQIIALASLVLLAIGCFFVLRPFLSAILWAIILCFSTWPLYIWLVRKISSTTVAAVAMTMLVAAVFVLPFAVIGPSLAQDIAAVAARAHEVRPETRMGEKTCPQMLQGAIGINVNVADPGPVDERPRIRADAERCA